MSHVDCTDMDMPGLHQQLINDTVEDIPVFLTGEACLFGLIYGPIPQVGDYAPLGPHWRLIRQNPWVVRWSSEDGWGSESSYTLDADPVVLTNEEQIPVTEIFSQSLGGQAYEDVEAKIRWALREEMRRWLERLRKYSKARLALVIPTIRCHPYRGTMQFLIELRYHLSRASDDTERRPNGRSH